MRRKAISLLVCILLFAGLLTGCGNTDISFVYYTTDGISTLDPQLASTGAEKTIVKNLFAGLYRTDENGDAAPDRAASAAVSSDGLVWTFTLRGNDTFRESSGTETAVTAADYVFALQRVLTPATGSPDAARFLSVKNAAAVLSGSADASALGVRAVSDTVLEITLESPDDSLPEKLALAAAMPCSEKIFENAKGAYGLSLDKIAGNGAFRVSAWSAADGLTLRRRQRGDKLVTRIRIVPDDGSKTPAARLLGGTQDGALITGEDASLEAAGYPSIRAETTVLLAVFNCSDSRLASVNTRAALASVAVLSADDLAAFGWLSPPEGLVPGAASVAGTGLRNTAGNAIPQYAEAQSYAMYRLGLSDSGLDRLSGITVLVPETEPWNTIYQTINQRWQRSLSAFFSLKTAPLSEIRTDVTKGNFSIALLPVTLSSADPGSLLQLFKTGASGNLPRYSNTEYDGLVDTGLSSTDAAAKLSQYAQAEKQLLADAPLAPLAFEQNSFYLAPGFSGIVVSAYGGVIDLTNASKA